VKSFGISPLKFWSLTIGIAVVGFVLHKPLVLDHAASATDPEGPMLAGFMVLTVLSALAMGIGVSMLVFGGRVLAALPEHVRGAGRVVQLGLVWLIAPWMIHEGLHVTNGSEQMGRLLVIEYGFHVTSYVAAILVAVAAARVLRALTGRDRSSLPA